LKKNIAKSPEDEEHLLAPGEVARSTAEQKEATERERVRVDDPLQVGLGHLRVALNRRQRDVDDRRVENDHELRHTDEAEDEPRIDVVAVYGWTASDGEVRRHGSGP
jgi:hypothetical protein